jgi:glycerol-3-phosphate acyltransferase PlsY
VFTYLAVSLIGYLIGSVPAGYIAGRMAGVDIRNLGSGNVGATNVLRVLGKRYGYPVFVFDFLKGAVAVEASILIFSAGYGDQMNRELCSILSGISCVIGHSYPVWLRFKGGKGVATSAGVIFVLIPLAAVIVGVVWIVTFEASRYVSVASVAAALTLPLTVGAMLYLKKLNGPIFLYLSICLALVVIWRHRSNLSRLKNGTEQRFRRK